MAARYNAKKLNLPRPPASSLHHVGFGHIAHLPAHPGRRRRWGQEAFRHFRFRVVATKPKPSTSYLLVYAIGGPPPATWGAALLAPVAAAGWAFPRTRRGEVAWAESSSAFAAPSTHQSLSFSSFSFLCRFRRKCARRRSARTAVCAHWRDGEGRSSSSGGRLPNGREGMGWLIHYDLDYNVALVSTKYFPDIHVEDAFLGRQLQFQPHNKVVVVGRCFNSGKLLAATGMVTNDEPTEKYTISTCEITRTCCWFLFLLNI